MDCRFFRGKLSLGDRQFLLELLKQYDAKLMLESWVRKGQVKKPSGRSVNQDKVKATEILKRPASAGKRAFAFTLLTWAASSMNRLTSKKTGKQVRQGRLEIAGAVLDAAATYQQSSPKPGKAKEPKHVREA